MKNGFGRASVPPLASTASKHVCMSLSFQQKNDLRGREDVDFINKNCLPNNSEIIAQSMTILTSRSRNYLVSSTTDACHFVGIQRFYGVLDNAVGMRAENERYDIFNIIKYRSKNIKTARYRVVVIILFPSGGDFGTNPPNPAPLIPHNVRPFSIYAPFSSFL